MALGEPDFAEFERDPAPRRRAHHADAVPRGLALPGRVPAACSRDHAGGGPRRSRAPGSSTSPRPRSTRTSRTSSTAGARASGRGRSGAWSTRRATSPTYDHKPEMSAAAAGRGVPRGLGSRLAAVRRHQLRQRWTWSATPGSIPGRGERRRGGRRRPGRGDRGGPRRRRRVPRHGGPRQRGADARARRLAEHRALHQPGPGDRHGRRTGAPRGNPGRWRRRSWRCSASSSPPR